MKIIFRYFLLHTAMIFTMNCSSQTFEWLTGTTGHTVGNGVTIDTIGHTYVVGAISPSGPPVEFATGLKDIDTLLKYEQYGAYLARYRTSTHEPQLASVISLDTTTYRPNGTCTIPPPYGYVIADRVVVAELDKIYVLGVFKGCDIVLRDTNGVAQLTTSSSYANYISQKVFLACYDEFLTPQSCHIICSDADNDVFIGDIARGIDPGVGSVKLFLAAAVHGSNVIIESFGSSAIPVSGTTPISTIDPSAHDIYLAQFDVAAEQLEKTLCIGGQGMDVPGDLASGYLGLAIETSDLHLCGAFQQDITFVSSTLGNINFNSKGEYDLFACRFAGFDLDDPQPVVAGGLYNDQALALSDNGKYVGGYLCDSAIFPTDTGDTIVKTTLNGGFQPYYYSPLVPGNKKENAFIAQPIYSGGTWISIDTVVDHPDTFSTKVTTMTSGLCSDFHVSWVFGMHANMIGLPWEPLTGTHIQNAIPADNPHKHYSTLSKWEDMGTEADFVWSYDFVPLGPLIGSSSHLSARYISDMESCVGQSFLNVPDITGIENSPSLIFTGRFGDTMAVKSGPIIGVDTTFVGKTSSPYVHGEMGMFLGAMNEVPWFNPDTLYLCYRDTVVLPITLDSLFLLPGPFQVDTNLIYYTGEGIIDSAARTFSPTGTQSYWITGHVSYFGCYYSSFALRIELTEDPFPIKPLTVGTTTSSKGLAVARAKESVTTADGSYDYNFYYNAGVYTDSIGFETNNGNYIWLHGNGSTPTGYVVCYDPCGAVWATNFVGNNTGGYVENLYFDTVNLRLYACGSVEGALDTIETYPITASAPSNPVNNSGITTGGNSPTNFPEKGFVAQLNAATGGVNWIYLGGDVTAQTNRFHGMDQRNGFLYVIGEYSGSYDYYTNTTNTITSVGGYDVMYTILDTLGAAYYSGTFGTPDDDHGDAVSVGILQQPGYAPTDAAIYLCGYAESGLGNTLTHSFTGGTGTSMTSGHGKNVFAAVVEHKPSIPTLIETAIDIIPGVGDDYALDIIYTDPDAYFGPTNNVVMCGKFAGTITPSGLGSFTTSSGTDFDGYILAFQGNVGTYSWLEKVGVTSSANESVDALCRRDTFLYATGKFTGFPGGSWWLTGFGNGLGRTDLYTIQFTPSHVLIDSAKAVPDASGINESTDICMMDTSLLSTGSLGVPTPQTLTFNSALTANTNNDEVFIARSNAFTQEYFKRGRSRFNNKELNRNAISVYPNPNTGEFTLLFSDELTGIVRVVNTIGQEVWKDLLSKSSILKINADLPSGIYFVRCQASNFDGQTSFIVVK